MSGWMTAWSRPATATPSPPRSSSSPSWTTSTSAPASPRAWALPSSLTTRTPGLRSRTRRTRSASRWSPCWWMTHTAVSPSSSSNPSENEPGSSSTLAPPSSTSRHECPNLVKRMAPPPVSDLQPGVLQVELALDPVHHVVADLALVAQDDDRPALGLEQLPDQALVGQRPVLGPVILPDPGPFLETPAAELVQVVQPLHGVLAGPVLHRQLVEPVQGGVGRGQAGPQLLVLLGPVVLEVEPPDQGGQGQPLEDQGGQDDREGQEQDQVAHGEVPGQGQGRGQRHRPAHAAPAEHQPLPGPDPPGDLGLAPVDEPDQVGDAEHPAEAHGDDHGADQHRLADQDGHGGAAEAAQDRVQLQADQDEQDGVGQVDQDLPEREAEQPGGRRGQLRGPPADVQAGGHRGAPRLGV